MFATLWEGWSLSGTALAPLAVGTCPQLHLGTEGPCACPACGQHCPRNSSVLGDLRWPHLALGVMHRAPAPAAAAAPSPLEWLYTTLTKAKPTPQGQQFPKKANRLFPFTGCSQNLISQHDQSLHWDDLLSYSNKMNILTNNTHKIHWTAQWEELQCMKS